ncbi:unnamed protein product [Trypanosoma congolense IL3000]|uniref:WGS project CAEQ00000000 data, annotated contig 1422 n=1 Tax=Trypanosoma congolense (strain IL3000) TaxID=1068625 RepID=F9W644_TRYCI|nr:unnamed protein product [Trypanosoma congolense IL3000]
MEGRAVASPPGDSNAASSNSEASPTDGNRYGRCAEEGDKHFMCSVAGTVSGRTSLSEKLQANKLSDSGPLQLPRACTHNKQGHTDGRGVIIDRSGTIGLPVSILSEVFQFLHSEDLCTVLGVSRRFFCAALRSDQKAWRAMCFSLWRNKQGLSRVVREWRAVEEVCRQEELEMIRLQQTMARDYWTRGSTPPAVSQHKASMQEGAGSLHWHQQHQHLSPHKSPPTVETSVESHRTFLKIADRANGNQSMRTIDSLNWCQHHVRVPALRNTPTYNAIANTVPRETFLCPVLTAPQRSSHTSVPTVSGAGEGALPGKTGLYWWQLTPERQQQLVIRCHQNDEVPSCPWSHQLRLHVHPSADGVSALQQKGIAAVPMRTPRMIRSCDDVSIPEGHATDVSQRDGCGGYAALRQNSYEEFERGMGAMSLLGVHQRAQRRMRISCFSTKTIECLDGDEEGEESLRLPVSWKFAYYMSIRDSRRSEISMQELIEGTWFVCFRKTGNTHPARFNADNSLFVFPAVYTRDGGDQVSNDSDGTSASRAPVMPPVMYQLQRGGAVLTLNSFPPLKVHRRCHTSASSPCPTSAAVTQGIPTSGARAHVEGGWPRAVADAAEAAALRAFASEPYATLRHIADAGRGTQHYQSMEHVPVPGEHTSEGKEVSEDRVDDGEDDGGFDNDWGWTMQNYFVKIFSSTTSVPLYVRRLEYLCGQ